MPIFGGKRKKELVNHEKLSASASPPLKELSNGGHARMDSSTNNINNLNQPNPPQQLQKQRPIPQPSLMNNNSINNNSINNNNLHLHQNKPSSSTDFSPHQNSPSATPLTSSRTHPIPQQQQQPSSLSNGNTQLSNNNRVVPSSNYPNPGQLASSYPSANNIDPINSSTLNHSQPIQSHHHQQQQQQPKQGPSNLPPNPNAPSSTVIYPWSHRRLGLLPPAPFPGDPAPDPNPTVQARPSPSPFPRYGHSVNAMGTPTGSGDLYIFAGLVSDQVKNDLYVLGVNNQPNSNNPQNGPPGLSSSGNINSIQNQILTVGLVETRGEVPLPRVGHASVGVGNVLIVWGGDTKTSEDQKQDDGLYLLNLSTREWTRVKVTGQSPEGRYGHSAAIIGSKFYIFGGQTDNGSFMNDLWAFDLHKLKSGSPKWQLVDIPPSAPVPSKRTGHTVVTFADSIFVFGGTDGQYHYNDTWKFDAISSTWTELDCIGYIPLPREGHSATLVEDVMYVLGGRGVDGKDLDDLAAFKISNQRWYMFQNMGPAPAGRSGHAMTSWQGKVYVLGGESYTSVRTDDPSIVHVLDTGKIKYPPDPTSSPRQVQAQQNQKMLKKVSSNPGFSSQHSHESMNAHHKSSSSISNGSTPPPAMLRNNNSLDSTSANPDNPRNPKRFTSVANNVPVRPRRDDDPVAGQIHPNSGGLMNRRTMGPGPPTGSSQNQMANLMSESANNTRRSMSPSSTIHSKNASVDSSLIGPSNLGPGSKPSRPLTTAPQLQQQQQSGRQTSSPLSGRSSSEAHPMTSNLSGSPVAQRQIKSPQQQQQQQPYHHSQQQQSDPRSSSIATNNNELSTTSNLRKDRKRLIKLQKKNLWMRAALSMAVKQGFVLPEPDDQLDRQSADPSLEFDEKAWLEKFAIDDRNPGGNQSSSSSSLKNQNAQKFVETLVNLKRELANAKGQIVDQAKVIDDRFTEVNRTKTAALQEASFYRVKLAAYEASSVSEVNKLERERISDLEHKLSDVISCKNGLERQVSQMTSELEHERTLRELSEENALKSYERSQELEALHSRSLLDYEELLNKTKGLDINTSRSVEKLDNLNVTHQEIVRELESCQSQLKLAESSNQQYLNTLEHLQKTLGATNTRVEEVEKFWEQAKSESEINRNLTVELSRELDNRLQEFQRAQSRVDELESLLETLKGENETLKTLNERGIAELVETSRSMGSIKLDETSRALRKNDPDSGVKRSRDGEGGDDRSRATLEITLVELSEVRTRNMTLEKDLVNSKSELSEMRARLRELVQETNKIRNEMSRREFDLKEKNRIIEAAEVKASLMKNLMGGVEDSASRSFESNNGAGSSSAGMIGSMSAAGSSLLTSIGSGSNGEGTEQLTKRVLELQYQLDQQTRAQRELERQQEETAREMQVAEERYREAHRKHEAAADEIASLVEEVQRLRSGGASSVSPASAEGGQSAQQGKVEEELQALQERHRTLESTHIKAVQYVKGTEKMLRRMKEELSKYKERTEQLEEELNRARQQSPPPMMRDRMNELNSQIESLRSSSKRSNVEQEELKTRMSALKQEYESSIEKLEQEKVEEVARVNEAIKVMESENLRLREDLKRFMTRNENGGDGEGGGESFKELRKQSELLKKENIELQNRCKDAEAKISLLLDHMENHSDHGSD